MSDLHLAFWPKNQPRHLTLPRTHLFFNAQVAAARYPDKPYILFYDTPISFARFHDEAERIAGFLQQECGVQRGDRVLLYMQNSPQFVLAYYGILRADAVVVPVNPMNMTDELRHYVKDTGAKVAFAAQDLHAQIAPLLGEGGEEGGGGAGLEHVIVAAYSDYIERDHGYAAPPFVTAPRTAIEGQGVTLWHEVLARALRPQPMQNGPDDLAVMPYTSGTTGFPKGCMHTHRSVMYNTVAGINWVGTQADSVLLSVLPFFHVTGMQGSMNSPLYAGATMVLLPRWDRDVAARMIERYRINGVQLISTMVVDLLSNPRINDYDLSSLNRISGGGAAMPEAIAQKMKDMLGIPYLEGYGMSETMAATHLNPADRPKKQCLGMPLYDVDSRILDTETMSLLPQGGVGEIIVSAPQVMQGYWNNPAASADAFIEFDGKRFLRTGDIAMVDEDGYFFMVDRLKRMINASGFKVWPAEVEALLYHHPAIQEACIIAAPDAKRGETVKAVVVLKEAFRDQVSAEDIIAWSHEHMAAYKIPRIVEFRETLPKSASGKLLWREMQQHAMAQKA